ncbi:ferredoxin--NADP reductase [Sphingomonas crocodyli]|uniref:ferredoxin--NADP(+) reductase n=1 Tax=Sphingomonas crocodyli TaxID=1979270 RepID=A0A437M0X9_9SPHN|nr:ferredoxin--NADP reductase [Sphingomonas crocodyli]RVT91236.1 ferredoxin--NADP reductase [Sphingomonas crocodyli]
MMSNREPVKIPESSAFYSETVLWVKHWNEHLFSFAISRPAALRFRSGEFVMIGLPQEGGKPLLRAYSIASPSYSDEIEFLSIKVEDGPLTSRLQKIVPGDEIYMARKTTGTLVTDALKPGRRLFLLATGTGLAPFLSVIRDPDVYVQFEQIIVLHSVRRVSDLAYRELLEAKLEGDPLLDDDARAKLHYIPTVTREPFHRSERITTLLEKADLFDDGVEGEHKLDPMHDRAMMCGSMDMIKDCAAILERLGFEEGSNAHPADFVIEKAFVG